MKATDYMVQFLEKHGVTDVFGYPGAVICHFMDSVNRSGTIKLQLNYHEQASAFAACGYAQRSGKVGVAYSNGGPGATNLITGIANAWYDAIPTIFIAGQVDTTSMKGDLPIRQRGIQEIPITQLVKSVSKYAVKISNPQELRYYMERAYWEATTGRPGPVVLELPADVQRADIDISLQKGFVPERRFAAPAKETAQAIVEAIKAAKRPCFLIGNGIRQSNQQEQLKSLAKQYKIPMVFSLRALDILTFDNEYNFGFMGSNGYRYSNFIVGKSDLIIALGARLDVKQVGDARSSFAPDAKLIRVDIDEGELAYKVRDDEQQFINDLEDLMPALCDVQVDTNFDRWLAVCKQLKVELHGYDFSSYHYMLEALCDKTTEGYSITADVGQHQIYLAQACKVKEGQSMLLSTGLASMGYSLPAAIGAYYADNKPVLSLSGDGGIQMNIQELQFITRENIPVKIVVFNNNSLGMIREFQTRNFNENCIQSTPEGGYTAPNMEKIANAYGLPYKRVSTVDEIKQIEFTRHGPEMIEIMVEEYTHLSPRMSRNQPIQNMVPELKTELYNKYMSL